MINQLHPFIISRISPRQDASLVFPSTEAKEFNKVPPMFDMEKLSDKLTERLKRECISLCFPAENEANIVWRER
jgi:hypothetical protein